MATGPGKYDDEATLVMERTQAQGVVIIVIQGQKGNGMSMSEALEISMKEESFAVQGTLPVMMMLPTMLRSIADQIEQDMAHA